MTNRAESRETARSVVLDGLRQAGLDAEPAGPDRWMTVLAGEWKRTIPVLLVVAERSLQVTSLVCARPDEGHADVYGLLLHKNEHSRFVHFALDDDGNIVLSGAVPTAMLDRDAFDGVLGSVLELCDAVFNKILRVGFASYVETEQRWRAANGLPPNPVATEG